MSSQMQVTVPAGIGPGMQFLVNTPSGQMQVTCPPDAQAGGQMLVNVPLPQAMAAPVPMVMAQWSSSVADPMMMGKPMDAPFMMGAAIPMEQAPSGVKPTIKISLNVSKKQDLQSNQSSPASLAALGMSAGDWMVVWGAMEQVQKANFFYDCPPMECCYYCCPGGPLQTVLCMLNPITCCLCFAPVEKAKAAATLAAGPTLAKYGLRLKFEGSMEGDVAIIAPQ